MAYETKNPEYQTMFDYMKTNTSDKDNQGDFVDRIFNDKSKVQKTTVNQLLKEISLREELHKNLLAKIDEETMMWDTYLMNLPNRGYEIDPVIPKRRSHIEDVKSGA